MIQITTEYQGGLRCEATHGPSQNKLITDAPVDNHGKGESFSPTDLVATALGVCMATVMGIYAEQHEIELREHEGHRRQGNDPSAGAAHRAAHLRDCCAAARHASAA